MGMKFGIFAGLHGDEQAGTLAVHELVRWAAEQPEELHDDELDFSTLLCDRTGRSLNTRHSQSGFDLNREFWVGSSEPEVQYLERELPRREVMKASSPCTRTTPPTAAMALSSGSLLSEYLLEPALADAHEVLPRNDAYVIDGFNASRGIIKEGYRGALSAPPEQRPHALEVVFETPALAPMDQQVKATVIAVKTMLVKYRELQAYAPNLCSPHHSSCRVADMFCLGFTLSLGFTITYLSLVVLLPLAALAWKSSLRWCGGLAAHADRCACD